jgi:hypothetical protein
MGANGMGANGMGSIVMVATSVKEVVLAIPSPLKAVAGYILLECNRILVPFLYGVVNYLGAKVYEVVCDLLDSSWWVETHTKGAETIWRHDWTLLGQEGQVLACLVLLFLVLRLEPTR